MKKGIHRIPLRFFEYWRKYSKKRQGTGTAPVTLPPATRSGPRLCPSQLTSTLLICLQKQKDHTRQPVWNFSFDAHTCLPLTADYLLIAAEDEIVDISSVEHTVIHHNSFLLSFRMCLLYASLCKVATPFCSPFVTKLQTFYERGNMRRSLPCRFVLVWDCFIHFPLYFV